MLYNDEDLNRLRKEMDEICDNMDEKIADMNKQIDEFMNVLYNSCLLPKVVFFIRL